MLVKNGAKFLKIEPKDLGHYIALGYEEFKIENVKEAKSPKEPKESKEPKEPKVPAGDKE